MDLVDRIIRIVYVDGGRLLASGVHGRSRLIWRGLCRDGEIGTHDPWTQARV